MEKNLNKKSSKRLNNVEINTNITYTPWRLEFFGYLLAKRNPEDYGIVLEKYQILNKAGKQWLKIFIKVYKI